MYPAFWRGYFCEMIDDDNDCDRIVHLQFAHLKLSNEFGVKKIVGNGKDEDGQFTIEGLEQDGHYVFTYKNG